MQPFLTKSQALHTPKMLRSLAQKGATSAPHCPPNSGAHCLAQRTEAGGCRIA